MMRWYAIGILLLLTGGPGSPLESPQGSGVARPEPSGVQLPVSWTPTFRAMELQAPGSQIPDTLRILAYNTHHGEGMDGVLDLDRIGEVISEAAPDLVALQEVDHIVERTRWVDQAAEYGAMTMLEPIFGEFMTYQGGEYGMALLSRYPMESWTNHQLPPGAEPRSALTARIQLPGSEREVVFVGVHLYRTEEERMAQAQALLDILEDEEGLVILAGDFNSLPGSPVMERLANRFTVLEKKGPPETFPADAPEREIDFILVDPVETVRVLEHRVLNEDVASDHRPVFLVLEIR